MPLPPLRAYEQIGFLSGAFGVMMKNSHIILSKLYKSLILHMREHLQESPFLVMHLRI